MMSKAELFDKVKDYLTVNNKPNEDSDVENYIYLAAYEKLMKEMYGNSPIDNMKKQNTILNEPKNEQTGISTDKFGGKVTIRMK